ncbi:MAG: hypothetical protein VX589_13375 [Myxococcota bacterium]|nr:hypothetical protein [Myxococcota bacterium]
MIEVPLDISQHLDASELWPSIVVGARAVEDPSGRHPFVQSQSHRWSSPGALSAQP